MQQENAELKQSESKLRSAEVSRTVGNNFPANNVDSLNNNANADTQCKLKSCEESNSNFGFFVPALSIQLDQERMERQRLEACLADKDKQLEAVKLGSRVNYVKPMTTDANRPFGQHLLSNSNIRNQSSQQQNLTDRFNSADVEVLQQKLSYTEKENVSIKFQFNDSQEKIKKLTRFVLLS